LGVLAAVLVPLQTLNINFFWLHNRILQGIPLHVMFAWCFLLAIWLAEWPAEEGAPVPKIRYAAGAAAASVACLAIAVISIDFMRGPPRREVGGTVHKHISYYQAKHRMPSAVFALGFDGVLHGWLATFIYAHLRNARMAARALARAQIETVEAKRRLLASRLAVAHAEIDPEAVLRALEEIEDAYSVDANRADALVADLTARLRDAIPHLRAGAEAGRARR
jgi:hypothetical protein